MMTLVKKRVPFSHDNVHTRISFIQIARLIFAFLARTTFFLFLSNWFFFHQVFIDKLIFVMILCIVLYSLDFWSSGLLDDPDQSVYVNKLILNILFINHSSKEYKHQYNTLCLIYSFISCNYVLSVVILEIVSKFKTSSTQHMFLF